MTVSDEDAAGRWAWRFRNVSIGLRDGVITASSPGMATQDATHGQVHAFKGAMGADGLNRVLRTRRRKPARRGSHGGNHTAIELNGSNQRGG